MILSSFYSPRIIIGILVTSPIFTSPSPLASASGTEGSSPKIIGIKCANHPASLPGTIQRQVDKALKLLDADFRHPGLRSHPVEGAPGIFEAYMDSKYPMTFSRRRDTSVMRHIDNHDKCLRNP
jgi:hypothetical protein